MIIDFEQWYKEMDYLTNKELIKELYRIFTFLLTINDKKIVIKNLTEDEVTITKQDELDKYFNSMKTNIKFPL